MLASDDLVTAPAGRLAVASQINASLLYALANVLLLYLIALRRGWFLKF